MRQIVCLRKIRATDEMRVQFKPAHQRIALTKFHLLRFRQATQTSAQPITIALANARENSNTRNLCRIGYALDHIFQNVSTSSMRRNARPSRIICSEGG